MDVINFISKTPSLPDGPAGRGMLYGDGAPHFICGPRIHEFLQEMHREVFAGRRRTLLTVGEMPGVTVEDAALFTDPARREVDMVFQFEHVALDQAGRQMATQAAAAHRPEGSRWAAGRPASPNAAGTACTGTTTTSPAPSPGSATTASTGAVGETAGHHPAPAPRHAVRLPGRRTGHDQHAVRRHRATSGTSSPQPPPRGRHAPGPTPTRGPGRPGAAEPGQRPHPDAVGRQPRTPASPPARPGSP